MNIKAIVYYLGWLSLPISALSLLNIIFCSYFKYNVNLYSYVIVLGLVLIFFLFSNFQKILNYELNIIEKIFLILIGWFFFPLFLSVPYYFSFYNLNFFSSYFEAISGFSSYGFSVFSNPEIINEPLLLWRSGSQWVGGLFYIVSIILVFGTELINFKPIKYIFFGKTSSALQNNFFSNYINILYCYVLISLFILFLLNLTELRLLDKFNLMLSIVSSGGFYIKKNLYLISDFDKFIVSISLLLSSLNIFIFYYFFKKDREYNFKEDFYVLLFYILIPLILIILYPSLTNFFEIFLSVALSASNTGIVHANNSFQIFSFILLLTTFVGGSLISTTSGFKLIRIVFFFKKFLTEILKILVPSRIIKKNIFGSLNNINNSDYFISLLIFIFYFIIFVITFFILSFDQLSFDDTFKVVFLTLNNTLPTNFLSKEIFFDDLFFSSKLSILLLMVFSKTIFISIFVLIKNLLWKR